MVYNDYIPYGGCAVFILYSTNEMHKSVYAEALEPLNSLKNRTGPLKTTFLLILSNCVFFETIYTVYNIQYSCCICYFPDSKRKLSNFGEIISHFLLPKLSQSNYFMYLCVLIYTTTLYINNTTYVILFI